MSDCADAVDLLVTGANGFVGRSVCAEANKRGLHVTGVVRSASQQFAGIKTITVDEIGSETNWTASIVGIDVVIHLAARVHVMKDTSSDPLHEFRKVNTEGSEHLARSAAAMGVRRFVYVSSIKVNGEESGDESKFNEFDAPNPQDPYGVSKWESEQALHRIAQETGLEVVIVRPPLVYGAGVKGNFVQMLNVLAKGVPLPLASIQNLRSLIYVENLVDALILCATHPAAAGQTYLVSDGEDVSTPDLLRQLGIGIGCPARLFDCPLPLLKIAGRFAGKSEQVERLLGSLQVDNSKIRRELGWKPPYTLQQGLQETAQWYRDTSKRQGKV